jgi:hypothetical protein
VRQPSCCGAANATASNQTTSRLLPGSLVTPQSFVQLLGFVGDPWLFIILTLCHILHFVSHWLVLDLSINCKHKGMCGLLLHTWQLPGGPASGLS